MQVIFHSLKCIKTFDFENSKCFDEVCLHSFFIGKYSGDKVDEKNDSHALKREFLWMKTKFKCHQEWKPRQQFTFNDKSKIN